MTKTIRGFTLIELLIIMTIIALISSLVIPDIKSWIQQFNAHIDLKRKEIKKKSETYKIFICGEKTCEEPKATKDLH